MKPITPTLVLALLAACASTGRGHNPDAAAQLARLKSLEGDWTATSGQGSEPAGTFHYEIAGGGSAVCEKIQPDGGPAMVTMYHLDGGDLVLTHYCALGNQPHMVAEPSSDPNVIRFHFAGGSNMDASHDQHMHDAELHFVDADHVRSAWTLYAEGKQTAVANFSLARSSVRKLGY